MAETNVKLYATVTLKIVGGSKTTIGIKIISALAKLFGIKLEGTMTVHENA